MTVTVNAVAAFSLADHDDRESITEKGPAKDPIGLVRGLLDKSILASHKRPRKAISSQSVVKFKREKRQRKRQYLYPSNWGEFVLYCKTGWLLQILPNGFVNGTNDINSPYGTYSFIYRLTLEYRSLSELTYRNYLEERWGAHSLLHLSRGVLIQGGTHF